MIEKLSIRNFKVLREVDVKLKPLTVIVGPNASGKSSILHAIGCLMNREEKTLRRLRSKESRGLTKIEATACFHEVSAALSIEVKKNGQHSYSQIVNGREVEDRLFDCTLLKLEVSKLSAPSYPKTPSLQLPSDGEGLSSVLAGIYLEDLARYKRLLAQVRNVIPSVRHIHIKQTLLGPREPKRTVGYQIFFDMNSGKSISASDASDGTILTLGLLTVLSAPDPPNVVMIDDVERGFHPKALQDLVEQLRRIQRRETDLQIIATSHSPYLLDFLKADEILLTSLDEDGYATVRPLVEHPDYERWKDLMAPGEFWSSVGEDWITKEKKATAR